jgi:uncharacterized protein YbaR (Trm112 family)
MNLLACPICKHHPLKLHIYEEKFEIIEGLLLCEECSRWYPIIDEIPYMLPDELRDGKDDLSFMEKWKTKLPLTVLQKGKPFNESHLQNT